MYDGSTIANCECLPWDTSIEKETVDLGEQLFANDPDCEFLFVEYPECEEDPDGCWLTLERAVSADNSCDETSYW
jgi:hypothetical protein